MEVLLYFVHYTLNLSRRFPNRGARTPRMSLRIRIPVRVREFLCFENSIETMLKKIKFWRKRKKY